jgi:hypothetical protein
MHIAAIQLRQSCISKLNSSIDLQPLSDENSHSIGFAFSYLDLPEDKHSAQATIKVGNSNPMYFAGDALTLSEFKASFGEALARMKVSGASDFMDVVEIFKDVFAMKAGFVPSKKALARKQRRVRG